MRTILSLLAIAGCGGTEAPPKTMSAVYGPSNLARPAAASPKKTPKQGLDVFPLLRDGDGGVPGIDALSLLQQPDRARCGGIRVLTVRKLDVKIDTNDQELAALFELTFPAGLDFTDGPKREASLERFTRWVAEIKRDGDSVRRHYASQTKTADETGRVIAVARLVQIQRRIASLFVRAEIPLDVRTEPFASDKTAAFCEKMVETAEPLLAGAEQAATACAEHARNIPPGWWSAVCVP